MTEILSSLDELLHSGSSWIYFGIFLMAVLEGFALTTFFVNGTIGMVAVGVLISQGYLNPFLAVVCIYIGTIFGDSLSYFGSTWLQKLKVVDAQLRRFDRFRQPLAQSPVTVTALAHCTPYLKGISAVLSGGILPWQTWLKADAIGAFFGTVFFTGLGTIGGYLFTIDSVNSIPFYIGIIALILIIVIWFRSNTVCDLTKRRKSPSIFCPDHRHWKRLFFFLYFPFWLPIRKIEGRFRKLPTRAWQKNITEEFQDIRAGDILLVRLHAPAPWGTWAHTAIATGHNSFCHGFGKTITEHRLEVLPKRYAIVQLRVKCDAEASERAAKVASKMIGTRVSILARVGDTTKLSCAGLVVYAYQQVGITLCDPNLIRVIPDDLFSSPLVEVVKTVYTEQKRINKTPKQILEGG